MFEVFAVGVPLILKVPPVVDITALYPLEAIAVPVESLVKSCIIIASSSTKLLSVAAAE